MCMIQHLLCHMCCIVIHNQTSRLAFEIRKQHTIDVVDHHVRCHPTFFTEGRDVWLCDFQLLCASRSLAGCDEQERETPTRCCDCDSQRYACLPCGCDVAGRTD